MNWKDAVREHLFEQAADHVDVLDEFRRRFQENPLDALSEAAKACDAAAGLKAVESVSWHLERTYSLPEIIERMTLRMADHARSAVETETRPTQLALVRAYGATVNMLQAYA